MTTLIKPYSKHPASHWTQKGPLTAAALGLPIPCSDHQAPRDSKAKAGQRTAVVAVQIKGQPTRRTSPLWLGVRRDQATPLPGLLQRMAAAIEHNLSPDQQKSRPPGPINLLTTQQVRDKLHR
jgi:hypothetical protein